MTRSRLAPFRRAQFRLPGRLAKSWDEHDAIVTAIMRGDGVAAGAAAKAHVSIVSEASAVFALGEQRRGQVRYRSAPAEISSVPKYTTWRKPAMPRSALD